MVGGTVVVVVVVVVSAVVVGDGGGAVEGGGGGASVEVVDVGGRVGTSPMIPLLTEVSGKFRSHSSNSFVQICLFLGQSSTLSVQM